MMMNKVANLKKPIVAAINGSALTGIQGFSYASTLAFGDY